VLSKNEVFVVAVTGALLALVTPAPHSRVSLRRGGAGRYGGAGNRCRL